MLAGHAGLAFAARARFREVPLAALMCAAFLLDLIWPLLLLTGTEHVAVREGATEFTPLVFTSYPWTHSMVTAIVWGVVAAIVVRLIGWRGRGPVIIAVLVASHWFLDAIVHTPDLPLSPLSDAPLAGLGLWNSVPGTLAIEGLVFAIGVGMYWRRTVQQNWIGSSGFWAFVITLGLAWASGPVLPPPLSERGVALGALALWIVPFWAGWFDAQRGRADGVQAKFE